VLDAARGSRFAHALSAHQDRTAAGLLALLVLVYLWPALVGGGVLAPLALLYDVPPWTALRPHDLATYFNPGLLDVTLSYYPWDVLARELIHSGTFPAWNPYALGGTPFFANPEVGWLSPFNVPLWVLPLNYALGLSAAVKLWVAGFGAYLLVRELRLGFWPGLLAGVSFALCAFQVVWLSHSAFTAVSVLLPWLLLLAERIMRRGRSRDGLALAGVVAVAVAGGHPGTEVHVLSGAAVYALLRAGLSPDLAWRERLRRLGLVGGACALGVLVMAVVLLPAQQAAIGTAGSAARAGGGTEEFHGAHMPFAVLRTALFPEWWGRPSEVIGGPSVFNERTFYAGTLALLLSLVGLLAGWRGAWRRMLPFAALGALGVAVALEAPGLHWLVIHLPGFDRVQNQRILLWFLLAVSVLGAFGLEALTEPQVSRRTWRWTWGVIGAALLAVLVAGASVGLGGGALGSALRWMAHRAPPASGDGVALASVLWALVFVVGLASVLLLGHRRPRWAALAGGLIVLLAALDMLHFAHGYQSIGPAARAIPPRTPAIAFLQRRAGRSRIAGVGFAVANDWSTVYRLRDARGYDAPQPSLRFYRLWRIVEPEQRLHEDYLFSALEPVGVRVLGLLGTHWVAARPGVTGAPRGLERVYSGRDATVFQDAYAMPRAIVASRVRVAGDENAELAAIAAPGFDPRTDAVVRRDELDGAAPSGAAGRARVVAEQNARVTLQATLRHRGVVLLDDAWAPGWSVTVDGRPARALQSDMVLRAVVVPAGTHRVVWSYRVPGLRAGAALSALGVLIAACWGGWLLARRRRFPLARGG